MLRESAGLSIYNSRNLISSLNPLPCTTVQCITVSECLLQKKIVKKAFFFIIFPVRHRVCNYLSAN